MTDSDEDGVNLETHRIVWLPVALVSRILRGEVGEEIIGWPSSASATSVRMSTGSGRFPWFRVEQFEYPLPEIPLHERVHRPVRIQDSVSDEQRQLSSRS